MKKALKVFMSLLIFVFSFSLISCSKKSTISDKPKITIATDADTKPFTYSDGENVTGYDIEVARQVFTKAGYEVEIIVTDFDSTLAGLDTGRYQVVANDIGYNEGRADKYYFSYPLSKSNNAVATKKDVKAVKLSDLAGKTTEVLPTANFTKTLQTYNENNPNNQSILQYVDANYPIASRLLDVESGKIDFILYDAISLKTIIQDQGIDLSVQNIESETQDTHDGYEYFVFSKDKAGKKLQEQANQALNELRRDGTLKSLSEKFFAGDFVPDAEAYN
ncbi:MULTISPECIES: transporter substrate-binding domain-containing protein [unclassified Enterococcus]|uniref:transporter substrate-binding domain-containing protein n=1 Tax=unclassified Enterococcus TaxID=2608891 RepID=UPI001556A654|nr:MULTISPECIES: transporter substrate-binding domain-containing protein [unclassified Enterococcus]MBS7576580.1 transporter substrate-binding domain-containing protein [Enterococcus sp. MMGLQ5-2]MBS7583933.1 transporter substrate-binding domain-containing protein [Enterococcus sp. MMGLQ5-1]NPD11794.1 transporter substrate-binding domain-containing protein [Enterococcus sp. MMGLQ5-1]NPD36417.1 transporter substrate-binding domain-containing protein [Enterococcus sp. MMGLQ5-2]